MQLVKVVSPTIRGPTNSSVTSTVIKQVPDKDTIRTEIVKSLSMGEGDKNRIENL